MRFNDLSDNVKISVLSTLLMAIEEALSETAFDGIVAEFTGAVGIKESDLSPFLDDLTDAELLELKTWGELQAQLNEAKQNTQN